MIKKHKMLCRKTGKHRLQFTNAVSKNTFLGSMPNSRHIPIENYSTQTQAKLLSLYTRYFYDNQHCQSNKQIIEVYLKQHRKGN